MNYQVAQDIVAHHDLHDGLQIILPAGQGCLNERPTVKFTVWTSSRVRIYPAEAFLPMDGFLPSTPTVNNVSARTRPYIHADRGASARTTSPPCPSPSPVPPRLPYADGLMRPRGRSKINKIKNFVVAWWKRQEKKMFGFRFSIPKIPKIPQLPELRRFRRRSREKKKVFSA
jgi:hypothetical protein